MLIFISIIILCYLYLVFMLSSFLFPFLFLLHHHFISILFLLWFIYIYPNVILFHLYFYLHFYPYFHFTFIYFHLLWFYHNSLLFVFYFIPVLDFISMFSFSLHLIFTSILINPGFILTSVLFHNCLDHNYPYTRKPWEFETCELWHVNKPPVPKRTIWTGASGGAGGCLVNAGSVLMVLEIGTHACCFQELFCIPFEAAWGHINLQEKYNPWGLISI